MAFYKHMYNLKSVVLKKNISIYIYIYILIYFFLKQQTLDYTYVYKKP